MEALSLTSLVMGDDVPLVMDFSVEVEIGPEANVEPSVRPVIARAFNDVGLAWIWVPLRGDRSTQIEAASGQAHLHVRLRSDADSSTEMLQTALPGVGQALANVRAALPALPLGIETVSTGGRRRFFAFQLCNDSEALLAAIADLEEASRIEAGVLGWDDSEGAWRPL